MTTTLIIPGLYSSGPDHWQTWFEEQLPGTVRVIQSDWTKPTCPNGPAASAATSRKIRVVTSSSAHSFGVLAAVHAAVGTRRPDRRALLVAPADPDKFNVTASSTRSTAVSGCRRCQFQRSLDGPLVRGELADRWGADFVNLGEAGHINADSGFGAVARRPWRCWIALRRKRAEQVRRDCGPVQISLDRVRRLETRRTGNPRARRTVDRRRSSSLAASRLGVG